MPFSNRRVYEVQETRPYCQSMPKLVKSTRRNKGSPPNKLRRFTGIRRNVRDGSERGTHSGRGNEVNPLKVEVIINQEMEIDTGQR